MCQLAFSTIRLNLSGNTADRFSLTRISWLTNDYGQLIGVIVRGKQGHTRIQGVDNKTIELNSFGIILDLKIWKNIDLILQQSSAYTKCCIVQSLRYINYSIYRMFLFAEIMRNERKDCMLETYI